MDPATAFSVACGAFQLAELCCKGVKAGWEIYQSDDGLTEHMREVEKEADHIAEATTSVKQGLVSLKAIGSAKLAHDQKRLQKSCEECLRLSTELHQLLDTMKPGSSRKLKDFATSLRKNAIQKGRVKSLRTKIEDCRRRLDTDLLISLGKRIDFANETQRRALADINETLLRHTKAYRRFEQQFESILGRFNDLTDAVKDESQKTRDQFSKVDRERAEADATRQLLESLSFADFGAREAQIQPTHSDTFEWIFEDDEDTPGPGDDLVQWLKQDGEIYWISGKPGSGKSTLTKFIAGHEQTRCHLVKWAADKRLMLLKFFFFRAGGVLERRLAGLLQSLIIQILQHAPEHSASAQIVLQAGRQLHGIVNWDPIALRKCLYHLLQNKISTSHRICFIIDGLDEAEDDADVQEALVNLVKDLSKLANTKLLLSSRPDTHLLREMERFPHLRLQKLTARDIDRYIQDRLKEHPRLVNFFNKGSLARNDLRRMLSEKADGVFLWIALAMKEMNRGLNRFDTPEEVLSRLRAMDNSLHGLFETMVQQIDVVHKPRVASLLWSLIHNSNALATSQESPDNDHNNILMLAFAHGYCDFPRVNENQSIERPFFLLEDDELDVLNDRLEDFRLLCQNQCAGLVDVYSRERTTDYPLAFYYISRRTGNGDPAAIDVDFYRNCEVRIVHRSLFEYLQASDAGIKLLENSPSTKGAESGVALNRVQSSGKAALMYAYVAWHDIAVSRMHDPDGQDMKHRDSSDGLDVTPSKARHCCARLGQMHSWIQEAFKDCEPLIGCQAGEDEAVSALLACDQTLDQILSNLVRDAPWLLSTRVLILDDSGEGESLYQLRKWNYLGQQRLLRIEAAYWGFKGMIRPSSTEQHLSMVPRQQIMAAAILGLRSCGSDLRVSKGVRNCGIIKNMLLMGADPNETIATQLLDGWHWNERWNHYDGWHWDDLDGEPDAMSLWQYFVAVLTLPTLLSGECPLMKLFSSQGGLVSDILRLFIAKGADQGGRITYRCLFQDSTGQKSEVEWLLQLSSTLPQLLQQVWTILETARWCTTSSRIKETTKPVHQLKSRQPISVYCNVESIYCKIKSRTENYGTDFYEFPVYHLSPGPAFYIAEALAYRTTACMDACVRSNASEFWGKSELEALNMSFLGKSLETSYPYDIESVIKRAVEASDWEEVESMALPRGKWYQFRSRKIAPDHDQAVKQTAPDKDDFKSASIVDTSSNSSSLKDELETVFDIKWHDLVG